MGILRKVKAFTLMEGLVSGIMISTLGGIAMVIYLNVAGSLTDTKEVLMQARARNEMDSLCALPGSFQLVYDLEQELKVYVDKSNYGKDSNLYLVYYEIVDSLEISKFKLKRLKYE